MMTSPSLQFARSRRALALCSALALATVAAVPAPAQQHLLVNDSDSTLYLTHLRSAGVPSNASDIARALTSSELFQLPPYGAMPISVAEGALVGMAFSRASTAYPTFALAAAALVNDERRAYTVVPQQLISGSQTTIAVTEIADRITGVRVDNSYVDWLPIEALASIPEGRNPTAIYREIGNGREEVTLGEATLWSRGGTDIETIKSAVFGSQLLLYFASRSEISRSRSLFLYMRADGGPIGTIEITGGSPSGLVLFWATSTSEPQIIGSAVNTGFFSEAVLALEALPANAAEATIEVASGLRDGGIWEEFLLTEIDARRLLGE